MKHVWLWWNKDDLGIEQQQLVDEGRDTSSVECGVRATYQPKIYLKMRNFRRR